MIEVDLEDLDDEVEFGDMVSRGIKGELPASYVEAGICDLASVLTGIIPYVPSPSSVRRGYVKFTHDELSGSAKTTGSMAQSFGTIISTIDPTSISDLVIPENLIWYAINKNEVDELHKNGKLWPEKEYEKYDIGISSDNGNDNDNNFKCFDKEEALNKGFDLDKADEVVDGEYCYNL